MRIRILVIEKDPEVGALYKNYLSRCGCEVYTVRNVEEAAVVDENEDPVDLIVGEAPQGWSTESFVQAIRQYWPDKPFIVASGRGDVLHPGAIRKDNRLAVLTKPFHMEELKDLVDVVLHPEQGWEDKTLY